MRLIRNTGRDRVVDIIRPHLGGCSSIDAVSPALSIFAFGELIVGLHPAPACRLVLPSGLDGHALVGTARDRGARNRLQSRWFAARLHAWLEARAATRLAGSGVPQGSLILRGPSNEPVHALLGAVGLTSEGLGLAPGNPLSLIQASETNEEAAMLAQWFETQWASLPDARGPKDDFLREMAALASHRDPYLLYTLVLHHLFSSRGDELDEEQVIKSATGIRNTVVWKKLYKFQRDGVVGAIDKLNRFGGCIIADSVGLGKTFEALAIIKSVYEQVVYDSGTEASFAAGLEKNEAVKIYAKLPGWFTVPTPLGSYNPDWAVLVEKDGAERLYLVVETKTGLFTDDLRDKESAKIECGKAHFNALQVREAPARYVVARTVEEIVA